ncbi:MAG: alpha/beta fold hydrolase [Vitreoscilla sp.]|nr:alpha/beta fold hydrolase [Polaromonas sp.]
MTQRLQWERDGTSWPHRANSHFIHAAGLRWHVQVFDSQPALPAAVLIHGTGASTHSWRSLIPLLTPHFKVLSLDLPGHAFTEMPPGGAGSHQLSMPGMAKAIGELLAAVAVHPTLLVGHSAGAAIAVRMALDGWVTLKHIVSINGALQPLGGLAGQVFSPVAKLMSALPFVPSLFSWQASHPSVLQKLIDSTGSKIDAEGMALYGQLVRNPGHAAGALGMMVNWDLPQLAMDLFRLATPLSLIVGSQDHTVSPRQADRLIAQWSASSASVQPKLITLPGLGHLAHEERPELIAEHILSRFKSA